MLQSSQRCFIELNPFKLSDLPPELVNFATGVKATPEVQMSLINALDKGDTLAQTFVSERLICDEHQEKPSKSFYATVTRSKTKTMADMNKSVKVKKQKHFCPRGSYVSQVIVHQCN